MASTCVVDFFVFIQAPVNRQTDAQTSQELVLAANVLDMICRELDLATSFLDSPAKSISRGYRFS